MVQKLDIGGLFQERQQSLTFTARDANDAIIDLTGLVVNWAYADSNSAAAPTATKSSGVVDEIDIDDPTTGVFVVNLTTDDTALLSGQYYYEAVAIDGLEVIELYFGTLEFRATIIPAPSP